MDNTPNVLIQNNLVFLKIDRRKTFIKDGDAQYVTTSIFGGLFMGEIYTYKEILKAYPEIKHCKNLQDIARVWG